MTVIGNKSKKNWKLSYRRLPIDGRSKHPLYRCYASMKSRCSNPNDTRNYELYGGRGIKVCDRWLGADGFSNFVKDMGERPTPTHSLDRIDNDGPYSPDNCRWGTKAEQSRNRRNNVYFDGYSVDEIASKTGKLPESVREAIRAGRNPLLPRAEPVTKGSWKHGTVSGYSNHRCRCDLCRTARNKKVKEMGWNRKIGPR